MVHSIDIEKVRNRLEEKLLQKGLTKRSVSLAAGLGPGYMHSILTEGKEPTLTRLASICEQLEVSMMYILYGIELSKETEEILSLLEANPDRRDGILKILDS